MPQRSRSRRPSTWRRSSAPARRRSQEIPRQSATTRAKIEAATKTPQPAQKDGDFATWFAKCLDSRDVHSDACFRAQQLIGYSDADFQAKFERYLAERDAKNGKPTPQPVANLDAIFKACGQTHDWTSNACIEAHVKSGLQPGEFRAKVEAKFGAFP